MEVVSLMLQPLYTPSERTFPSFSGGLGGLQSKSGRFGVEKNLLPLPRFTP